jgi:hypothetical protein
MITEKDIDEIVSTMERHVMYMMEYKHGHIEMKQIDHSREQFRKSLMKLVDKEEHA